MATIKLKKPDRTAATNPSPDRGPASSGARAPIRGAGAGVKVRPTLAQAQAQRAEREALYQEQLRQRFGDRPPASFTRRDDGRAPMPAKGARAEPSSRSAPPPPSRPVRSERPAPAAPAGRPANRAFEPRSDHRSDPRRAPPHADRHSQHQPPRHHRDVRDTRDVRDVRDTRDDHDDMHGEPAAHAPGSMRLSKRMSELGIASRREADEWIAKGWVRVDDQVVSELGSRVQVGQRITVDAKAKFQQAQRVTVLINKPVGYVSGQAEDGYEPALVLVTPSNLWREDHSGTRFLREHLRSLVPAGRLDIDSVGLLVLTQDGRVAKQLIGEDSDIEKEYLVRVASPGSAKGASLPESDLELLRHGLDLDGEALRPAQVEWINEDQLRFVLKQGKKRQIRRMCEAVGLQVLGLKRVRIGNVMLGDLPTGQWRYLRADESFA